MINDAPFRLCRPSKGLLVLIAPSGWEVWRAPRGLDQRRMSRLRNAHSRASLAIRAAGFSEALVKYDAVEPKIMVLGSSWISTYGAGLAGGTISKPSTLFGEARP